jgi:hypothetical protein
MNMSWKTETSGMVCRWSGALEHTPYRPSWMQASCDADQYPTVPPVLDFAKLSPFGGAEWYGGSPRSR